LPSAATKRDLMTNSAYP